MIPPLVLSVRISSGNGKRGFTIWLPLFLMWIGLLILFLPLFPLMILADFIMALIGYKFSTFRAFAAVLGVLSAMRGLLVDVRSGNRNGDVHVAVH